MTRLIAVILLLFVGSNVYGATKDEINHLLMFVETSDCVFLRNGKEYDGAEAVEHINKKYNHFKEDINSAEKFIELSATKSTISRQPYYIQCHGTEKTLSSTWLLLELARYRSDTNI